MIAQQMVTGRTTEGTQTTPRRRHGHLARTLTMASLTIALVLGLFGVGGVGPKAVQELFVEDAAAAGPCSAGAQVKYWITNGYYYVYGRGAAACDYYGWQSVTVGIYQGSTLVASGSTPNRYIDVISTNTAGHLARCGVRYQAAVVHRFNGYQTTHWSSPFYLNC